MPGRDAAWNPRFPAALDPVTPGPDRQRAWWFRYGGAWYANAVMVTLVALGLVERARLGEGAAAPLGFRLTDLGRAVFGAPEVAPPPEPAERRCLVIQPNFDVVAYLDQADARTAGLLGRIAETGNAHSGPIQTFRLTQASVYQAEESGLGHAQIVDFLQQHGQREPPANVLRSIADWSGKRESLSLRSKVTLLGFPTTAERDAYLKGHPEGTACGDRFVIGETGRVSSSPARSSRIICRAAVARWSWTRRAGFARPSRSTSSRSRGSAGSPGRRSRPRSAGRSRPTRCDRRPPGV